MKKIMRLGIFGTLKDVKAAREAGYDCIEAQCTDFTDCSDAEFEEMKSQAEENGVSIENVANPLPLNLVFSDPKFDLPYWKEYLEKQAYRANQLNVRFCCFGSSRCRRIPSEGNVEQGRQQIYDTIAAVCDAYGKYNMHVLLEPIGTELTNFAVTIPETVEFIRNFGKKNLRTMVDMRWYLVEHDSYEELITYADDIRHIHIDNPLLPFPNRSVPTSGDGFDYDSFFDVLWKIGYNGVLSIETNTYTTLQDAMRDGIRFFEDYGITSYRRYYGQV